MPNEKVTEMSEWNEACSQAPCNHEPTEGEIEFVEGVKRENAELRQRAEATEAKLEGLAVEEDWTKDDHVAMVNDANEKLQAYADGLEVNLKAVIQRAEAAEKALAEAAEDTADLTSASVALVDALETCHVCAGEVCIDTTEPTHCEDCSADCERHKGDECVPVYVLVNKVRAAIRAARGE